MSKSSASLIAMRGAGYYSDNTVGAKAVIDAAGDMAIEAIRGMNLTGQQVFAVADYGAADGRTSLDLMKRVVATVREINPQKPISITYTDLPHNDFSVCSVGCMGLSAQRREAPLATVDKLFTFASGTSFHRQILPDETLSFGFSATAMHWLSRQPAMLADHVQAVGAERNRARAVSRTGGRRLERDPAGSGPRVAPGGKLLFANFCVDEQGRYLGNTGGVNMFDRFATHWRDLAGAGAISQGEYEAGTLQQFYRNVAEFEAPFKDPASPVRQARLETGSRLHARDRVPVCYRLPLARRRRGVRSRLHPDLALLDREHLLQRPRSFAQRRRTAGDHRQLRWRLSGGRRRQSRRPRHGLCPLLHGDLEERRSEGERFELIMALVDQRTLFLPSRASDVSLRHGRACPGHPRRSTIN